MTGRLRRLVRDDRGSAMVAAFTLMFALTGGSIIWLTRDVDRAVNAAAEADAVAFQAARAGAQAINPASLRSSHPTLDPTAAATRATQTAATILTANQSVGRVVAVSVDGDRVTVTVAITEAGRTVTGRGTARLQAGITGPGS